MSSNRGRNSGNRGRFSNDNRGNSSARGNNRGGNSGGGDNKYTYIGAMWQKSNDNGDYFSVSLNPAELEKLLDNHQGDGDINVVAFTNRFKEEDRHPDFKICYNPDNQNNRRN